MSQCSQQVCQDRFSFTATVSTSCAVSVCLPTTHEVLVEYPQVRITKWYWSKQLLRFINLIHSLDEHNGTVYAIRHCLSYQRSTNVIPRPVSLAWVHQISNQSTHGPEVGLFCSYGSPTGGQPTLMLAALLGWMVSKKRFSCCRISRMHPQSVLFYNRARSDDVVYRQYTKEKKSRPSSCC